MAEQQNNKNEELFNEEELRQYLLDEDIDQFRSIFFELHSYDQAQFYEKVGPDIRQTIYQYLSPQEMATIFETIELEDEEYEQFLKEMDTAYGAEMLSYMYTDDAVDVLNELDDDHRESYLEIMDSDLVEEINELLAYAEYTAGAIMTKEFVSVYEYSTVRSAMNVLRKEAPNAETIYYVFVVDDDHRLTGVISLRDLIISDEDTLIHDIMNERVVYVKGSADQEEVAQIMKDYNFLALPVVNDRHEMQGIITVDDIIDVIDEEASDDYSKMAGLSDVDDKETSPIKAAKKRLPWLIMLLFLGMVTATLMGQFEQTLEKVALLALFIPLISGTSGNSGTQALAVAIRSIATGDIDERGKFKMLLREVLTGLTMGIVCGILVVIIIFVWKHSLEVGLLVGAAISVSILVATIAGSFIPLLIHKLGADPAVASGPFITTLNDVTSILIYLGLATTFLGQLN